MRGEQRPERYGSQARRPLGGAFGEDMMKIFTIVIVLLVCAGCRSTQSPQAEISAIRHIWTVWDASPGAVPDSHVLVVKESPSQARRDQYQRQLQKLGWQCTTNEILGQGRCSRDWMAISHHTRDNATLKTMFFYRNKDFITLSFSNITENVTEQSPGGDSLKAAPQE